MHALISRPPWKPGRLHRRIVCGVATPLVLSFNASLICRWVPEAYRSRALTAIHALYNAGNVLALSCTPLLVAKFGWPWALRSYAALGLLWAVRLALLTGPHAMHNILALGTVQLGVCRSQCPARQQAAGSILQMR